MNGYMNRRNIGCGCCNSSFPRFASTPSRSETITVLEEYKNDLEAEIASLEHRLQSYKKQEQS